MSVAAITVHLGTAADAGWLAQQEVISAELIARKLVASEYLLAERDAGRVGFLRLDYLWSTVPYIALIRVLEPARRQGAGRALLTTLETYLRERGHRLLLSSSQADEPESQAWHRRMGFEECGVISGLNDGGVGEIFFRKQL